MKAVRDAMNRMLDVWRDVPDISNNLTTPSQLKSSSIGTTDDLSHFFFLMSISLNYSM